MKDKKNRVVKIYYYTLTLLLVLYFVTILLLNNFGIFKVSDNILVFFIATFLYYVIVKNTLANIVYKKLGEIDPEYKNKKSKLDELREKMPGSSTRWYKNGTILYIIALIVVFILIAVYLTR